MNHQLLCEDLPAHLQPRSRYLLIRLHRSQPLPDPFAQLLQTVQRPLKESRLQLNGTKTTTPELLSEPPKISSKPPAKRLVKFASKEDLVEFLDDDSDHRIPPKNSGDVFCRCTARKKGAKGACLCASKECPCTVEGIKCHPRWGALSTIKHEGAQARCYCTSKSCNNPEGFFSLMWPNFRRRASYGWPRLQRLKQFRKPLYHIVKWFTKRATSNSD